MTSSKRTPENARRPKRAGAPTPLVFISYRRSENLRQTTFLEESLAALLGPGAVFRDKTAITPGDKFPTRLDTAIRGVAVVLVLIGPGWVELRDEVGPAPARVTSREEEGAARPRVAPAAQGRRSRHHAADADEPGHPARPARLPARAKGRPTIAVLPAPAHEYVDAALDQLRQRAVTVPSYWRRILSALSDISEDSHGP